MPWMKKTVAALGIVAVGVVVQCGDRDDDDDDKEEKREAKLISSAYAQEVTASKGETLKPAHQIDAMKLGIRKL